MDHDSCNSYSINIHGLRWPSFLCSHPCQSFPVFFLSQICQTKRSAPLSRRRLCCLSTGDVCNMTQWWRSYSNLLYLLPARKNILFFYFLYLSYAIDVYSVINVKVLSFKISNKENNQSGFFFWEAGKTFLTSDRNFSDLPGRTCILSRCNFSVKFY